MRHPRTAGAAALAAVALAGCVPTHMGPTVMVVPAPGKPFETFAQEQDLCRGYADVQVSPSRDEANNSAVGAAVLGTALGAGLGAAIGGGGAAIGAAGGALGGTAIGATNSAYGGWGIQQQYDMAYGQCMYAKGNQVAGFPAPVPNTPTITPNGGGTAAPQGGAVAPQAGNTAPQGGTVAPRSAPATPQSAPPSGGGTVTPVR